jgi:hypothetical protein
MQKTQNFSCLFRHYAKHNGLRKEDLVFFFVDELLPDQMPETVHLMPHDEIWVEHRKDKNLEQKRELDASAFTEQFRQLFLSSNHSDVTFVVGDAREDVMAHKGILSARSAYFAAMFRPGGMSESKRDAIEIAGHDCPSFKRMLEFIYTNAVKDLDSCSSSEIISLLMIANEFVLDDLRGLCEQSASRVLGFENIGKFMLLSVKHNADDLRDACKHFVRENGPFLKADPHFRQEIADNPELGLLLFDFSHDEDECGGGTGGGGSATTITGGAGAAAAAAGGGSAGKNKRKRIESDPIPT